MAGVIGAIGGLWIVAYSTMLSSIGGADGERERLLANGVLSLRGVSMGVSSVLVELMVCGGGGGAARFMGLEEMMLSATMGPSPRGGTETFVDAVIRSPKSRFPPRDVLRRCFRSVDKRRRFPDIFIELFPLFEGR